MACGYRRNAAWLLTYGVPARSSDHDFSSNCCRSVLFLRIREAKQYTCNSVQTIVLRLPDQESQLTIQSSMILYFFVEIILSKPYNHVGKLYWPNSIMFAISEFQKYGFSELYCRNSIILRFSEVQSKTTSLQAQLRIQAIYFKDFSLELYCPNSIILVTFKNRFLETV